MRKCKGVKRGQQKQLLGICHKFVDHNRKNDKKRCGQLVMTVFLVCLLTGCDVSKLGGGHGPNNNTEELAMTASKDGQEQSSVSGASEGDPSGNTNAVTHPPFPDASILDTKDYGNLPTKCESWWFKRNSDHLPSGAQEDIDLAPYRAFYLDEQAMKRSEVDKVVYLTFDCGYENGYTEPMLDVLKKHNATATFFVTKHFIKDATPIVVRMKEEGHMVGNHTVTHPNLTSAPISKIKEEILGCQEYMKEATGYEMDPYFRPPKGEYSEYLLQVAKDLGYTTVFWSMAYLDYDVNNQPSSEHVVEHWNNYYHPGAIPLIHNVSSANANALDTVLTNLEQQGYRFGSLDEIKTE